MEEVIERLSREAAEELNLDARDQLYIKNLLLRFSVEVFEGLVEQERKDNDAIRNR
jgi:hypothetical protein